jgi:hypothetical protein
MAHPQKPQQPTGKGPSVLGGAFKKLPTGKNSQVPTKKKAKRKVKVTFNSPKTTKITYG